MPDDATASDRPAVASAGVSDPRSAMTPRFNLFFRWFAKRYFRHFDLDDATVQRLRDLESRSSVFYVMRYASRLDYFLFNTLFAREGLRLSAFANGLSFYYYQPLLAAIRVWLQRRRMSRAARRELDLERGVRKVREVARSGESAFLFLRTARRSRLLRGRRAAVAQGRRELDLLGEIVDSVWSEGRPVHLVPLALFWRKGPRSERRFLNLSYGAPTRPSDFAKVSSFLITYRDLSIKVGDPIDLRAFVDDRRQEGRSAIARKVRRSILVFLYREERVVEGPTLRSLHRVQETVLADPRVEAATLERSRERRSSPEAARAAAERIFREISANMNSTFLALLNVLVTFLFRRIFVGIEATGLPKVADYAKQHPVVLVPSHRSYFDFLILSWLFYANHMIPPHIAARENMAFGPFGFLFRRAGAFFLRPSFEDPLYKEIFRRYVGYLVREGFTQEFFIEGGRSRTGKSLTPRLGMLSWNIEAFIASGRRDLFFVPVAITYERLVEESSMVDELEGGAKQKESMLALVRARKVLERRFGSVFVNFGEPISLAQVLEGRRELFQAEENSSTIAGRRAFTESLGNEIVERINWAVVANATSVAAAALLGEPRRGMFRSELTKRMGEVVDLLRLQDVRMTPALVRDEGEFNESIAFLLRAGLIKSERDPRGEILYYEKSRRRALDVYRNVLFHFLVAPSLLARQLQRGATLRALREDLGFWLDLLYRESFAPKATVLGLQLDALVDYFERIGAVERCGDRYQVTEKGRGYIAFLAEQTRSVIEAYCASFSAILVLQGPSTAKQLQKSAEEQFARGHLLGEVRRTEGWNPATFRNALELLTRRGILKAVEGERERERSYARGEAFEDLAGLRERLAAALLAG
jgi:glycerol-3-phosphate O-acyltransferase